MLHTQTYEYAHEYVCVCSIWYVNANSFVYVYPMEGSSHSFSLEEFSRSRTSLRHHLLHLIRPATSKALHLLCPRFRRGTACSKVKGMLRNVIVERKGRR